MIRFFWMSGVKSPSHYIDKNSCITCPLFRHVCALKQIDISWKSLSLTSEPAFHLSSWSVALHYRLHLIMRCHWTTGPLKLITNYTIIMWTCMHDTNSIHVQILSLPPLAALPLALLPECVINWMVSCLPWIVAISRLLYVIRWSSTLLCKEICHGSLTRAENNQIIYYSPLASHMYRYQVSVANPIAFISYVYDDFTVFANTKLKKSWLWAYSGLELRR